jgi:thiol-disulfide isomerase/thioredoxin
MRVLLSLVFLLCALVARGAEQAEPEPTVRSGHIDLLDAETLQYYMDESTREDFDVVVLFYAQWCSNCRGLSPVYIRIAELLSAGDSQLILGYFDCEADMEHATLCSNAGITHYPTIQFYSLAGQTLPSSTREKLPKHATQFAGNWQVGEAIMDWIKAMSFLSRWHRAAWGEKLRGWLFGKKSKESSALPVGIPHVAANARKVETLKVESATLTQLALRSSSFVDALLCPTTSRAGLSGMKMMQDDHSLGEYPDVFGYLAQSNGWFVQDDANTVVVRTCIMEASLDMCQRYQNHAAEEWVHRQTDPTFASETDDELVARFTEEVAADIALKEPYCGVVEDCIVKDYAPAECRPEQCPFHDPVGCRYMTACLAKNLKEDYAAALGLTLPPPRTAAQTAAAYDAYDDFEPIEKKRSGWGV